MKASSETRDSSHRIARRAVVAGGLATIGVVAMACGASDGGQASAPSKRPIKLSFLSWRPIAMEQFAPAWQDYGKKQNVTFDIDPGGDGAQTKLITMFASDTAPDLFDANTGTLPKMYDTGFVLQLDKYLSRDRVNLDKEWALIGIERWRQKTYGVPYWVEPHSIYYNKTLFRQRGVPDPWEKAQNKGDWTMEEMVEAARKINDPGSDTWGLQWGMGDYHGIGPLVWTQGVSHLQYDPKIEFKLQLPEYVDAVTWSIDWMMRQKFNITAPTPEAGAARDRIQGGRPAVDRPGGFNLFASGKVGIHWRSVNDWRRMWPMIGTGFEWDMLPVPSIKGKPGASWSAAHPVCAWSKTKEPDASWGFMRWLIGDEFQGFLAENQFLVPAKKNHQTRFFRPPEQYKYQHPQVFANVYKRPYGILWSHYNAGQNGTVYGAEMGKIIKGEVAVSGGLKELERLLNQDIEFGGGENPFKGIRWPLQPK